MSEPSRVAVSIRSRKGVALRPALVEVLMRQREAWQKASGLSVEDSAFAPFPTSPPTQTPCSTSSTTRRSASARNSGSPGAPRRIPRSASRTSKKNSESSSRWITL